MDWLRVIAFAILVVFHVAVLFLPDGIPSILNHESSPLLGVTAYFFHQFRLSLLFLVAGIGVYFSLRSKTGGFFFKQQSKRLLVPLFFGILVLVPPMIYFEKLYNGGFSGSFWTFYPKFYSEGVYPVGNFSWHHFWFLAYLYIICLIRWPIFQYLQHRGKPILSGVVNSLSGKFGLYKVVLPLIVIEIALRPLFSGIRDLLNDWANFSHWWVLFMLGFLFASDTRLLERSKNILVYSFGIGLISSGLLFTQFYDFNAYQFPTYQQLTENNTLQFVSLSTLKMISVWAWVLTFVGFSVRFLNRPSRLLRYLNSAIYPLYCLHLTITVILAYFVIPLNLNIPTKLITITAGTFFFSFMFYELLFKRILLLRPLVGAK